MRTLTFFVAVVVVVFVSSCARTGSVEADKAALLEADREWSKTAKDADRFLANFAPTAVVQAHGMPAAATSKDIRSVITGLQGAPGFDLKWQPTAADASGDLGYTIGTYQMTLNNAAGMPVTETGKYTTVWKRSDGAWKVVVDTFTSDTATPVSSAHVVVPAAAVKWVDPPPSVPPGAKLAVISGDPGKPEMFTIRLQFPNGYKIAPHWHPTDEHVTVLSGTFAAAMGKAWDDKALANLPAGSYAVMAATMPHYATARGATVVQVHGMGPFVLNYVNPADDPSKK